MLVILTNNSATFMGVICTLSVLCFWGIYGDKKNGEPLSNKIAGSNEGSNFIHKLLSIILYRATFLIGEKEKINIEQNLNKKNRILSEQLNLCHDYNLPYIDELRSLVNDIDFCIVKYQNETLTLRNNLKKFHNKIAYEDIVELLSSPFYSFIFCLIIFVLDFFDNNNKTIEYIVFYFSILSLIYWSFIWLYYCISIKTRDYCNNSPIIYRFKPTTAIYIIITFTLIFLILGSIIKSFDISGVACFITITLLVVIAMFIKFVMSKRNNSIFSHYFNMIHLVYIFIASLILSTIQKILDIAFISIDKSDCQFTTILFALCSCIIFPLMIPLFRFYYEIFKSNRILKKYTKESINNVNQKNSQINNYLKLLEQIRLIRSGS